MRRHQALLTHHLLGKDGPYTSLALHYGLSPEKNSALLVYQEIAFHVGHDRDIRKLELWMVLEVLMRNESQAVQARTVLEDVRTCEDESVWLRVESLFGGSETSWT